MYEANRQIQATERVANILLLIVQELKQLNQTLANPEKLSK